MKQKIDPKILHPSSVTTTPIINYRIPNALKVSVAITKLTPSFILLFSSFIESKEKAAKKSTAISQGKAEIVRWPSSPPSGIPTSKSTDFELAEQVNSMLEEAKGFSFNLSETKQIHEHPSQSQYLHNQEPFIQLKTSLNELELDTKKEFTFFLTLMRNTLQSIVAPIPMLVEQIPREILNPFLSVIGLLENIGGEKYSEISASFVNWIISCFNYILDEPSLSDSSWLVRGNDLFTEGLILSDDIVSVLTDPWLQGWIKRFTEHFKQSQDIIACRIPPTPPPITAKKLSDLFLLIIGIRDWFNYLLFKLPQYVNEFAWQFPTILFPHWIKKALRKPLPRIEFRQKKIIGWIDNIGSIKGKWNISLQSLSRVYPKKDPYEILPGGGPWTPGLRNVVPSSSIGDSTSRWFVHLDISSLLLSNARYSYRYKSRWFALGFKKKSFADTGRVDVEMGKRSKGKKLLKDQGISVKMELGVPGILGAPIVSQPAPFTGFSMRGIRVLIKDLDIRFKSDRHPNIYPVILPFANSMIKKRITSIIENEVIRLVNGIPIN